ncbi:hypothetical protein X801_05120 [Opisthorchis viverrini]|uniref:Programmed cell death protein 2 C-terminal domain-containing protein n=1 Tax=Opisthorchis viverrini TaxID=6198 RepID=A0A1S8WX58_OPIVI|nr:hypothetical protein X801_05120 [Opisthorchis viverrini]
MAFSMVCCTNTVVIVSEFSYAVHILHMALVGFVSQSSTNVQPTVYESFIGGSLLAYPGHSPPPDQLILCKSCRHRMCFIAQIYCPLGGSSYHRSLYLFVCLKRSCQLDGFNWIALRSQSLDCEPARAELFEADWAFDDSGDENETKVDSSWNADTDSIPKTEKPLVSQRLLGPFLGSFLEVFDDVAANPVSDIIDDSPDQTGSHANISSICAWLCAEEVERAFVEEDDNTMEKAFSGALSSHLANRSEHGLEDVRYHWGGCPIFNGRPPRQLEQCLTCSRCHSPRVFEVQLFSVLNNSLKLDPGCRSDAAAAPLPYDLHEDEFNVDWPLKIITVIVFSCSSSCWSESDEWVEECVVVQTDTDRTCIVAETFTVHCTE